jgi:hypothetical protein
VLGKPRDIFEAIDTQNAIEAAASASSEQKQDE